MSRLAILILLATLSLVQQPGEMLAIEFSMDTRAADQTGHKSIYYAVTGEGWAFDWRVVYDHGHQDGRRRQLSRDGIARLADLLRSLPDSDKADIPQDWLVTVTRRDGREPRVTRYHRMRLPTAMKEILELMGGLRPELTDSIGFSVR